MKRLVVTLALALALIYGLTGCAYSKVTRPLDTDVWNTELGDKVGYSSAQSVLYLVAWGDAGTAAAAKNGGLSKVNHLDVQIFSVLFGLYTRVTTIAYGE